MSVKVLFIRHASTAGNEEKRYIGKTDEPLSVRGIREAQAAGGSRDRLSVYVSPLSRTLQTARILFPNARLIPVAQLREMDFGAFEGKNAGEMESDLSYRQWVDGGCLGRCPGGESRQEFAARVQAAFEKLLTPYLSFCSRAEEEPGSGSPLRQETAVFVLHGGSVMAILEKFARPRMSFYEGYLGNCKGFLCTVSVPGQEDGERQGLPFVLKDVIKMEKIAL